MINSRVQVALPWRRELMFRAGDGIRTHEYQLGRLMPYHLATPACITYINQPNLFNRNVLIECASEDGKIIRSYAWTRALLYLCFVFWASGIRLKGRCQIPEPLPRILYWTDNGWIKTFSSCVKSVQAEYSVFSKSQKINANYTNWANSANFSRYSSHSENSC